MLSGSSSRSTSLTLHRGCTCRERTALGAQRLITSIPYTYAEKKRADERTRTADLSLRVIGQALQRFAGGCKCRISKGVSFPCLAAYCTVLRSRWYQIGIRTSDSYSPTAGPMASPRDLRSHNPPTPVCRRCLPLQNRHR